MINSLSGVSLEQLKQVVGLKEQISALEAQLAALLGGAAPGLVTAVAVVETEVVEAAPEPARRGRGGARQMSPEARARIVAAQKARWAKYHAQNGGGAPAKASAKASAKAAPKGGGMSAEGRARIIAAQKARWAKFHASTAAPAPAKKAAGAKKGGMSPEGRAAIIAAQKARWAKFRKQKKG